MTQPLSIKEKRALWYDYSMTRSHFHYVDVLRTKLFHKQVKTKNLDRSISDQLTFFAKQTTAETLSFFKTSEKGYTERAFQSALRTYGQNIVVREKRKPWIIRLFLTCLNPLMLLLVAIAAIALLTGDMKTAIIITSMIVIRLGVS